jgi:hypothetical protein
MLDLSLLGHALYLALTVKSEEAAELGGEILQTAVLVIVIVGIAIAVSPRSDRDVDDSGGDARCDGFDSVVERDKRRDVRIVERRRRSDGCCVDWVVSKQGDAQQSNSADPKGGNRESAGLIS